MATAPAKGKQATPAPQEPALFAEVQTPSADLSNLTELQLRARLASKLLILYEEVDYIQKTNRNQQQGYQFVSEADFAEKVSEACRKAKLVLIPDIADVEVKYDTVDNGKGGTRLQHFATVKAEYRIIDAETGYVEKFRMPGHGQDFSDKAIYKAITGAQKYAYYKLTLCATGTDPEHDTTSSSPAKPQQTKPATGKELAKPPVGAGPTATPPAQATPGNKTTPAPGPAPAQTAPATQGKPQEKPKETIPQGKDSPSTPQTAPAPKEQQSLGAPGGDNPPMDGSAEGVITAIAPPKSAQKAGQLTFIAHDDPREVIIWWWAERLQDGVTMGDLVSFHANKTPLQLAWSPDVTKRWRTLKTVVRTDIPDMGSPDYSDQAADSFTQ